MIEIVGIRIQADNLPFVVDAYGVSPDGTRHINGGEYATIVDKTMGSTGIFDPADNLPIIVDAIGSGLTRPRQIEDSKHATIVEKTMSTTSIIVGLPDNLPAVVDA